MSWIQAFTLLSLIPAIGFPLVYGVTAKWWKSFMGLALMYTNLTLLVLYGLAGLNIWLGESYPGKPFLNGLLLFMAFTFLWVQFIGYLVTLRRQKQELEDPETKELENVQILERPS